MKYAVVLVIAGLLSYDIIYTCAILQSSCRRIDRYKGHTEAIIADVLGRLGALEAEMRVGRKLTVEESLATD